MCLPNGSPKSCGHPWNPEVTFWTTVLKILKRPVFFGWRMRSWSTMHNECSFVYAIATQYLHEISWSMFLSLCFGPESPVNARTGRSIPPCNTDFILILSHASQVFEGWSCGVAIMFFCLAFLIVPDRLITSKSSPDHSSELCRVAELSKLCPVTSKRLWCYVVTSWFFK